MPCRAHMAARIGPRRTSWTGRFLVVVLSSFVVVSSFFSLISSSSFHKAHGLRLWGVVGSVLPAWFPRREDQTLVDQPFGRSAEPTLKPPAKARVNEQLPGGQVLLFALHFLGPFRNHRGAE